MRLICPFGMGNQVIQVMVQAVSIAMKEAVRLVVDSFDKSMSFVFLLIRKGGRNLLDA